MSVSHPAKFSDPILDVLRPIVADLPGPILDPFAGTGRIHDLGRDDTIGVELEPEWATLHPRTEQGNALSLRFADDEIGSIVTSPTYGNRMADTYAGDGTRRHTYRIALGRELSPDSSCGLQWGKKYRDFHRRAWREAWRVIRPGGRLVLNISDHYRDGEVVPVSVWHFTTLEAIGFEARPGGWLEVSTRRNRMGANADLRVDFESVILFEKPAATS
jgi:SAM-dependent methyltransferase